MRPALFATAALAAALPLAAQQNPFKPAKSGIKTAEISYTMSGDMTGTAMMAHDGERFVRRQTSTLKIMGHSSTIDSWSLTTPDSVYTADLAKKTGTVSPNPLPALAKAYDNLDGEGKKRFHANMEDMAGLFASGMGLAGLNTGEKLGTKSFAGQECEERKIGMFSVCTMTKAPIMLHMEGGLLCMKWEETATSVKLGSASSEAFTPPAGIAFTLSPTAGKADSSAHQLVTYMASQTLTDSLAKMHTAMADLKQKQQQGGKMTPAQEAQLNQACEMMKNFDMGKSISDASSQFEKELGTELKKEAANEAKDAAKSKIKGLFKKPKIP